MLSLDFISDVIDAEGNGNLLPNHLPAYTSTLEDKGATHIFILTDMDDDKCITETKNRIEAPIGHIVIVSIKKVESWLLADTDAMSSYLRMPDYYIEFPESVNDPYEEIKGIRMKQINRGTISKTTLANAIVSNHHFSFRRAASHPNCNSARYFAEKLKSLSAIK